MDPVDNAAPNVDFSDQQDLAGVVQSYRFLSILIGLAVVLFVVGWLRLWLARSKGKSVLLLGPTGSGKSVMFFQLRDGSTHNGTVASMQENIGVLIADQVSQGKPIQVVDVPGHPKVRSRFQKYIQDAKGVVYVVDSVDFMAQKTASAEQLLEILNHPHVRKRRIPLVIACNKSDEGAKAHTVDFVRKRLEKEIDQLRRTQSTLEDSGGLKSADIFGNVEEEFTFDALLKKNRISVSALVCSALKGELGDVRAFISRCARL